MVDALKPERAGPVLVLVSGQVASGKSTISRTLAARLGADRLEADRVRGTLLTATEPEAVGAEARWRRDLSPGFEDEIYADLLQRAEPVLAAGLPLVLDACFPRRRQRAAARALARAHGVPFLHVECVTPDAEIRARLARRDGQGGPTGWLEIHRALAEHYEPSDELGEDAHMEVAGEGPVEPSIERVLARLAPVVDLPKRAAASDAIPLPRAVSFDCWGTLLVERDWPWAHALRVTALLEAAREVRPEVQREAAGQAFDAAWRRHQERWRAGEATGAPEVAAWALAGLGLENPHPALEHLVHRFEEASHTSHVVALEGAGALFRRLDHAGVPRVLVCDTGLTPGRVVRRLLDRVELLAGLDVLAFSDEVGVPKPDARIFRAALEPLGVNPGDALHVGDLLRTDVAGARSHGMRSVRITAHHDDTSGLPEADHVVGSHADLARLMGLSLG